MKIYNSISLGMLTLAALVLVVPAKAEDKEKKAPSKAMLKQHDTNQDGVISAEEKEAAKVQAKAKREANRQEDLAKYDEDKDGKINRDERVKLQADRAAEKAAHEGKKEAMKAEREARKAKKGGK